MRLTSLASRRTALGAAATLSLAAVGIAMAPIASATAAAITLSASSGPSGGTNGLTASTSTNVFYSGLGVEFQYKATSSTTCSSTYAAAVVPASGVGIVVVSSPQILSAKKVAFKVPTTVTLTPAGSAASASWLVCAYAGSVAASSALTASAAYTVAAAPTVSAISPASGPALGGGTVTLTGTNFVSGTTAKIGSQALTGVTIVSSTTITATVPAQAAATGLAVTVTNTGGTATLSSAYSYTNGIIGSPQTTTTNTAATDVDVQGVGFSSLTFSTTTGSTPDDAHAHVYLVDGAYDPTDNGSAAKTLGELGECLNVLVISDTELICTVNTADSDGAGSNGAVIPNGTYTLTVVNDGGVDVQAGGASADANYSASIVSSGSTFTVAPY
jgi:IPT/TIG domain